MASSASIWGRRIQEFAGAKKTNDPDVDACVAKLTHLERDVLLLRKTLESSALVLSTTLPRARAGMTELMVSLGEFVSTLKPHYDSFAATHAEIDSTGATKLAEIFAKAVLAPVDEWLTQLSEARAIITKLEQARVIYDHYATKLSALQEEKRKTQAKGKIPDKASEERLVRNVEKAREGEAVYLEVRDRSVGHLLLCFDEAGKRLDSVLLRTMQYEKQVFEDGVKALRNWETPIADLIQVGKDRKVAEKAGGGLDRLAYYIASAREDRLSNTPINLDPTVSAAASKRSPASASAAATLPSSATSTAAVRRGNSEVETPTSSFASWTSSSSAAAAVTPPQPSAPAAAAEFGGSFATTMSSSRHTVVQPAGNPFGNATAVVAATAAAAAASKGNPFGPPLPARSAAAAAAIPAVLAAAAAVADPWGSPGDNSWDAPIAQTSSSSNNAWAGDFGNTTFAAPTAARNTTKPATTAAVFDPFG